MTTFNEKARDFYDRSVNHQIETTISSINSSTTNLSVSNSYTFTGDWELNYQPDVMVNFYADQICQLLMQFSNDGSTIHSQLTKNTSASINEFSTAVKGARYFRVVITSDSLTTTVFSLQTQYGTFRQGNAPANLALGLDADSLSVRPTNFQDEVVLGRRAGVSSFNKFAYRTGLTAAGGEETIWNATGNHTILTTASTFTITYNNSTDGAGGGATGALTLLFTYIDSNGLDAMSSHTLGSSGSDVTSFSGLGINRCVVTSSDGANGNVNDITITATTGGTIQAKIAAGEGVTQQAIFFVDNNSRAVAKFLWINILKISGGGSPRVIIKAYVFNRLITTKFLVFRGALDTSVNNTIEITEPIGFGLSAGDVLYFVADTDTNNTDIDIRFSLNEYKNN